VKYYPAFINLKNKKVVVVGGGRVAERKTLSLIKAEAAVIVISPAITAGLEKLKEKGAIKHIKRNYRKGDLKDAFVVVAGTSSEEINSKVAEDAEFLVNVVDIPSGGNFIVPSLIKRGPLTMAVSTEGTSPALAKAIRREIEELYNGEFARYLRFVELIRKKAIKKILNSRKREKFLKYLASEKVIHALRKKGFNEVSKKILTELDNLT
jgi:precorrin-2 dehydrogenase/sirohydrochlorin ferrochelatase